MQLGMEIWSAAARGRLAARATMSSGCSGALERGGGLGQFRSWPIRHLPPTGKPGLVLRSGAAGLTSLPPCLLGDGWVATPRGL